MQIDLEPKDYSERKPKGWRWRLPWSHPEDVKLPMVMFFLLVGFLVLLIVRRDEVVDPLWLILGTTAFAFPAGAMMVLWLRD